MFVPRRGPRFTEEQLRKAVADSLSWAETLRRLGYRTAGGNWKTLKKYAALWEVSTDHFDPDQARNDALRRSRAGRTPLAEILVPNSTYSRAHLKERLFVEGVKARRCELCGQDENWRGRRMSLILDHINGTPDDNRLENLRVVCPNCAATFDTHCARKNAISRMAISCPRCGREFVPNRRRQRYCSRACGSSWIRSRAPRPEARRVERPPSQVLLAQIERDGYAATGRRYGVSDNAIRKWVRFYENERT